jgi:hypothetical protein
MNPEAEAEKLRKNLDKLFMIQTHLNNQIEFWQDILNKQNTLKEITRQHRDGLITEGERDTLYNNTILQCSAEISDAILYTKQLWIDNKIERLFKSHQHYKELWLKGDQK